MKAWTAAFALGLLGSLTACADDKTKEKAVTPLEQKVTGIDGKELDLASYKGKVVLFVNVASKCGYTPQYTAMQATYEKYSKDGFVLVGVPSNDFGAQEKGTNEEIAKFCSTNYKVTFPMLEKQPVTGKAKSPLYAALIAGATKNSVGKADDEVSWNFEKFLVNRKGEVVGRYKSKVAPDSDELTKAIKTELDAK